MTIELYWLTMTALMTALFWLTYVVDRMVVRGLWATIADRKPEGGGAHSLWAQRAIRAHANAIENLVVFAAAVLVAPAANVSTPLTRAAAATYFFARLVHFLVYAAGVPLLRTLSFTVGWLAQLAILAAILGGA
jgi:uncharacterized MAPEG superfamily protein